MTADTEAPERESNLNLANVAAILVAAAALWLGLGYALSQRWIPLAIVGVAAVLWLIGLRRGVSWPASLGLVVFIGGAVLHHLTRVAALLLLPPVLLTLLAWDIGYFHQRLTQTDDVRDQALLLRNHIRRLAAVVGLALLLGLVTLGVRTNLTFGTALLLGLILVVTLSQAIRFASRESE